MIINIQTGHIARHTPHGAGSQGREAAIIDIAQDLLLRSLHEAGILEKLVFKGGTSLRKLYAGNSGRFSLDLDFSIAKIGDKEDDILIEIIEHIENLSIGPFTYGSSQRRGKWYIVLSHPFDIEANTLRSKIDISPPPWLPPVKKSWVPIPIHGTYGTSGLPSILTIRL